MAATASKRHSKRALSPQAIMISGRPVAASASAKYLRNEGFSISVMRSGKDANEKILSHQPQLVIVDISVDHQSGLDLLEAAKADGSTTKFIVISADGSLERAIRAMKLGALDYLPEPFEPGRLGALMRNAMGLPEDQDMIRLSSEIDAFLGTAGNSPTLRNVCTIIEKAAYRTANACITGADSFTREICAKAIHNSGPRRNRPFITMNCAAIPRDLVESELFGHVKGAFHGAVYNRAGLATEAHGGTLFLDGISELELGTQKKLLRFAEHGTFQRVGSRVLEQVDVRLLCGSHTAPEPGARNGRLRQDLYQRLSAISLHLPPANECRKDALEIAGRFLFIASGQEQRVAERLRPEREAEERPQSWPGSARELQETLEDALARQKRDQDDRASE